MGIVYMALKRFDDAAGEFAMTPNKQTVQKYMDAFNRTDHAEILSCLTEDVEWLYTVHSIQKGSASSTVRSRARP